MPLSDLEIVRIMCGSYLHDAGPELHIHVVVSDYRHLPVHYREHNLLTDKVFISVVIRIHSDSRIAKHSLWSCRSECEVVIGSYNLIFDVPEVAVLIFIFNLGIGYRRKADRAPVYHLLSLIDKPLVIKPYKDFIDRPVAALVHREALPVPVTGRAELL